MPLDGTNYVEVPGVFTLDGLIAFLETMPAEGKYHATLSGQCLLAQWAKHNGLEPDVDQGSVSTDDYSFMYGGLSLRQFWPIANPDPDGTGEHTFGAALERARALRAS